MSWRRGLVNLFLRAARLRRTSDSPAAVAEEIRRLRQKPVPLPRRRSLDGLELGSHPAGRMTVHEVRPRQQPSRARVLYLHGGSYTYEISPFHWSFITKLAREVPAEFDVPIYPLAPIQTAAHTVPAVTDLLEAMVDGGDRVVLMGDSAGGGMALAVAQQLARRGKQPARIVLIAPWLDVTMTDPEQREIEPRDLMLNADRLAVCGGLYAGQLDVRDPLVSPLFGSVEGLAPIDVFVGADDLLCADARRLAERAREAGVALDVHEAAGMQHVYPILPLLFEARQARTAIAALVGGSP